MKSTTIKFKFSKDVTDEVTKKADPNGISLNGHGWKPFS